MENTSNTMRGPATTEAGTGTATGGELLIGVLEQLGVRVAFGLRGMHNLPRPGRRCSRAPLA
jgi:hypothetical protein